MFAQIEPLNYFKIQIAVELVCCCCFFVKMDCGENDTEIDQEQFILSVCWDNGVIAGAYYDLITLELHVSYFIS
jgi:hypothetical protein